MEEYNHQNTQNFVPSKNSVEKSVFSCSVHYTSIGREYPDTVQDHYHHHNRRQETEDSSPVNDHAVKAKIIAHPQYSNLLEAYMDCQKVGAPPEVVARLTAVRQELEASQRAAAVSSRDVPKDPELDQFMEAYYDMVVKYREELTRPLYEAMEFMRRIEQQLNMLTNAHVPLLVSGIYV